MKKNKILRLVVHQEDVTMMAIHLHYGNINTKWPLVGIRESRRTKPFSIDMSNVSEEAKKKLNNIKVCGLAKYNTLYQFFGRNTIPMPKTHVIIAIKVTEAHCSIVQQMLRKLALTERPFLCFTKDGLLEWVKNPRNPSFFNIISI